MAITIQFNGGKLLERRQAKGLSRAKLSEMSGVSPLMIQNYETGRNTNPGIESLAKLALALGCMIENLIDATVDDGA